MHFDCFKFTSKLFLKFDLFFSWLPNIIDFFWQVSGDFDQDDGQGRRVLWLVEVNE